MIVGIATKMLNDYMPKVSYTKWAISNRLFYLIIDNDSCKNIIKKQYIKKLILTIKSHWKPLKLGGLRL